MTPVRKLLLCTTAVASVASVASAADMTVRKAPPRLAPATAPLPFWTGCFVGGHAGFGWGRKEANDPALFFTPPEIKVDTDGFIGGVQAGCDYQFHPNWVFGIEGTFSVSGPEGDHRAPFDPFFEVAGSFLNVNVKTEWLATLVGRLGYTQANWMLYGVGGFAWARDKYRAHALFNDTEGFATLDIRGNETRTGYVLGAGLAALLGGNWSGHVEYNFMDFGTKRVRLTGTETASESLGGATTALAADANIKQQVHLIKAGLNYRFGGASAVVAKY